MQKNRVMKLKKIIKPKVTPSAYKIDDPKKSIFESILTSKTSVLDNNASLIGKTELKQIKRVFNDPASCKTIQCVEEKNKNEEDAQNNDLLINKQLIHKKIVNLRCRTSSKDSRQHIRSRSDTVKLINSIKNSSKQKKNSNISSNIQIPKSKSKKIILMQNMK